MPEFGNASKARLAQCHPDLQRLFNKVIEHKDCTVTEGHRGKDAQDEYFRTGKSKVQYPDSMHNKFPSLAADVVPYPIDWQDKGRFYMFVGYVRAIADSMGIQIRCGADWDGDMETKDQNFHDLPHFELVNPRKLTEEEQKRFTT